MSRRNLLPPPGRSVRGPAPRGARVAGEAAVQAQAQRTQDAREDWVRQQPVAGCLPNLFRLGFETVPEEGAASGHARWIAQHILAHGLTDIRARDIGRCCKDLRGKSEEIAVAMEVLVDVGWAKAVETRRDSQHWAINPAVHVDFAAAAAEEKARRAAVVEQIKIKVQSL